MDTKKTVEILDDDCLECIFRHLKIVDRIKVERVCNRWREISKSSWSDYNHLIISKDAWGFKLNFFYKYKFILVIIICSVLSRCGKYLKSIDFDDDKTFVGFYKEETTDRLLSSVISYCPNIESIKFSKDMTISKMKLLELFKRSKNIKHLTLGFLEDSFNFEGNNSYDDTVINMKNLRSLTLRYMSGSLLFKLLPTNNLETLTLETYFRHLKRALFSKRLIEVIPKLNNLKKFKIDLAHCSYQNALEKIIKGLQNCPKLVELSLFHQQIHEDIDKELSTLFKLTKNLKILNFENCTFHKGKCLANINYDLIEEITFNFCKLNFTFVIDNLPRFHNLLKFEFGHSSNENGFHEIEDANAENDLIVYRSKQLIESICLLKNLQSLNVEGLDLITDDILKTFELNLKNLLVLNLCSCHMITDDGLKIISKLPKLENLNIADNDNITGKEVNNKILNLKEFFCSECDKIEIEGLLLNIIENSKCLEYLDIFNCPNVNIFKLIDFAIATTKKRQNNVILKIVITDNIKNESYLKNVIETSPYLQIRLDDNNDEE